MTKKLVKMPESSDALDLDGIDDYDLAVDGQSQDGQSLASEDVSEYNGKPKAAPRRVYIGSERCRKVFQLAGDADDDVWRVCGGPKDCRRAGHKGLEDLGAVGTYRTIKTLTYTDGLLETYRSHEEEDEQLGRMKALQLEAMERLTGSKEYQAQLKALKSEFGTDGDEDAVGGDAEDSKPPGRSTRTRDRKTPKKDPSQDQLSEPGEESKMRGGQGGSKGGSRSAQGKEGADEPPVQSESADLVIEIRDALKTMATAFVEVAQQTKAASRDRSKRGGDNDDEKASEHTEEDTDHDDSADRARKRGSQRSRGSSGGESYQTKWYYAVARGRIPGIYTDWGDAERQVNGYSGAVHKKFRDRARAEKFVRDHRASDGDPNGSEDSEEISEDEGSGRDRGRGERPNTRASLKTKLSKGPGMPPLEMSAPDPSIGNSKELFKMTLADDRTMCKKLSPPGLDSRTMKELADATLDAVQLPGMSPTESTDTSDLIGALKEIAEDKRTDWTEDRPRRDVQWKASN